MACRQGERYRVDYLEDLLSEEDRRAYEGHVEGCPECAEAIEAERRILAMVRGPEREAPSAPVRAAVLRGARAAAERAPQRRFRDIFESPLLQTLALATLVAGIAFIFEDQLPHVGLPSLKDTLRARVSEGEAPAAKAKSEVARGDRASEESPAPRAGGRSGGLEKAAEPSAEARRAPAGASPSPSIAASPRPESTPRAAPAAPALSLTKRAPGVTLYDDGGAAGMAERAIPASPEAPRPGASTAREADEASGSDAAAGTAILLDEIRELIDSKQWKAALDRVDAALVTERPDDDAIALLELGIEAADAMGDDVHSVRYRVERVAKLREREGLPPR